MDSLVACRIEARVPPLLTLLRHRWRSWWCVPCSDSSPARDAPCWEGLLVTVHSHPTDILEGQRISRGALPQKFRIGNTERAQ